MKEKVVGLLRETKFHLYIGISFFVFVLFLTLSIFEFWVMDGLRVINITPVTNLFFLSQRVVSPFALGSIALTVTVVGGLIRIVALVIRGKASFKDFRTELIVFISLWLVIFIAYIVTMSTSLWTVAETVPYGELESFGQLTEEYTVLIYNDLCSYTVIKNGEALARHALNLEFCFSLLGTFATALFYIVSDQLRRNAAVQKTDK